MKKQLPYILGSLVLFIILSFIYFNPVLSGQKIFQQDIMQYRGGAQEAMEYRNTFDKETYWSDSMFSGMPTYQSGAQYSYDLLKYVDNILGLFLPRPVNYFFMMFAGFFLLIMVWLKDWRYALAGAIFFGFSTYFFQITEAGHNAKVHTIAYFAPFLAGLWMLYERKYFWGFVLTTLFMGLQLHANHPQMTFYLLVALFAYGIYELIQMFREKSYLAFLQSTALLFLAFALAIGMNSARILSTMEYSQETTRGTSELSTQDENSTSGLDRDYITEWSYGVLETLNLMIPNFYGGGVNEKDFESPNFNKAQEDLEGKFMNKAEPYFVRAEELGKAMQQDPENEALQKEYQQIEKEVEILQKQFAKSLEGYSGSYWGDQPFTSGPAYIGVIVVMLAFLSLFWIRSSYKWWLLGATILSFMMAWGKNFPAFTNFMIDYFPFYNKFRAVSSALVVAELTLPAMAILGLYEFIQNKEKSTENKDKIALIVGGGIIMLLFVIWYLIGDKIFPFHNSIEEKNMSQDILNAIEKDRFNFFRKDLLRAGLFAGASWVILYLYQVQKIKQSVVVIGALAFLCLIDLWAVDKRYLNKEAFVSKHYMNNPFPTEITESMKADMAEQPRLRGIFALAPMNKMLKSIKDKDKENYRVFNTCLNPFQENNTSYFHHSIGGYHGAKLGRYQEVLDAYLSTQISQEVLNMLNTKYVLYGNPNEPQAQPNLDTNGNAWLVADLTVAKNPNEEFSFLAQFDSKNQAIVPNDTKINNTLVRDSLAHISLTSYSPNSLQYESQSQTAQFAVFSEIFYPKGWKASIDGKEVPIIKTNYLLRGLELPAGKHTILFSFDPDIVKVGQSTQMISFILFFILLSFGAYMKRNEWKSYFQQKK